VWANGRVSARGMYSHNFAVYILYLYGEVLQSLTTGYTRLHCLKYYDYRITSNIRAIAKFWPENFITKIGSVQSLCLQ
jgi:hypothetical protein